ncbi:MAG: GNAT family N-acetyltransferase [Thermoplasmata archaeon]|nr:GNAT family N-acetyltransferase [Thermoplasmata archaeon]
MTEGYEIRFVKRWAPDELVELYKAGNWWLEGYTTDGLDTLTEGSFAFVVAVEKATGKAVGMGRAISDGTSDAWLQDIVVLKEHRGRGLGREITRHLLEHCLSKGLVWIGLVAEPGSKRIYEPLGFEDLPGEPMVFRRRPDVRG